MVVLAGGPAQPLGREARLDRRLRGQVRLEAGHADEAAVAAVAAADLAGVVDGPPALGGAGPADAVELLEAEADRIHQRVAAAAGDQLAVRGVALAGGQRRIERRRLRVHAGRRRGQRLAQEALAHQLAAVDRRRRVGAGVDRQHRAAGEQPAAPGGVDRAEAVAVDGARRRQAVELGERAVDERGGAGEQRRQRAAALHHAGDPLAQLLGHRRAHRRRQLGVGHRILRHRRQALDVEPLAGEPIERRAGPRRRQHPPRVGGDHRRVAQLVGRGGLPQLVVGRRRPQEVRQLAGDLVRGQRVGAVGRGLADLAAVQERRRLQEAADHQRHAAGVGRGALERRRLAGRVDRQPPRDLGVGQRPPHHPRAGRGQPRAGARGAVAAARQRRSRRDDRRDLLGGLAQLLGEQRRHLERARVVVEASDHHVGHQRRRVVGVDVEQRGQRVVVLGARQPPQQPRPGRARRAHRRRRRARRRVAAHLADERHQRLVLGRALDDQRAARVIDAQRPAQQQRLAVLERARHALGGGEVVTHRAAGRAWRRQHEPRAPRQAGRVVADVAAVLEHRPPQVGLEGGDVGRARRAAVVGAGGQGQRGRQREEGERAHRRPHSPASGPVPVCGLPNVVVDRPIA